MLFGVLVDEFRKINNIMRIENEHQKLKLVRYFVRQTLSRIYHLAELLLSAPLT